MPAPDMLPVLLGLLVVVVVARLGGSAAEAYGQPAVLGELAAGILIGNLGFTGFHALDGVRDLPAVQVLAQVGVLFLLFEVGLETDLPRMAAVGASSLRVAALGVIAPMLLGLAASRAFFPGHHPLSHDGPQQSVKLRFELRRFHLEWTSLSRLGDRGKRPPRAKPLVQALGTGRTQFMRAHREHGTGGKFEYAPPDTKPLRYPTMTQHHSQCSGIHGRCEAGIGTQRLEL